MVLERYDSGDRKHASGHDDAGKLERSDDSHKVKRFDAFLEGLESESSPLEKLKLVKRENQLKFWKGGRRTLGYDVKRKPLGQPRQHGKNTKHGYLGIYVGVSDRGESRKEEIKEGARSVAVQNLLSENKVARRHQENDIKEWVARVRRKAGNRSGEWRKIVMEEWSERTMGALGLLGSRVRVEGGR